MSVRTAPLRDRIALAAATAGVLATLTGCGGGEPQVASADKGGPRSTGTSATAANSDVANYVNSQRSWVACLRKEGLDVTDPDPNGQVTFPGDLGALKSDPSFAAAQDRCRSLQVPMPEAIQERLQPKLSAAEIETTRKYADCMQRNGAPDFPDPGADGALSRDQEWDPTAPGARKATRVCAPIIGDPTDPPKGRG